MLACERSDHGFSGKSRGGHACRERLPQAGLRGSDHRWAARHSVSGSTQGATARHMGRGTSMTCDYDPLNKSTSSGNLAGRFVLNLSSFGGVPRICHIS